MLLSPTAIALNRFGLGARPDTVPLSNPRRWLTGQFDRFTVCPAEFGSLADAGTIVQHYRDQVRALRQEGNGIADIKPVREAFQHDTRELYRAAVQARVRSALDTPAPFVERMVHFWSNHFCISADNAAVAAYAGAFERDAIRPHVLGRFSDMLLAVEQHPAMLVYLNQAASIGPDSPAAKRLDARHPSRKLGLNENLGREIMELHTLGARSGYTQADVTEFARALTGWTIGGTGPVGTSQGGPGSFVFRPALHEPGMRTILGTRYEQAGQDQAGTALMAFAKMPATANHVATRLACHFGGDVPPHALVNRLATTFLSTQGDFPSLYHTLITSPEPWSPRPLKFKSPWEWTISALRGMGRDDTGPFHPAEMETQLGQPVWRPGSPAGWDDTAAAWAAPGALLHRVEMAARLAASLGAQIDARGLGARLIPASLSAATTEQVRRSESPASALALLLVSPEFLRR